MFPFGFPGPSDVPAEEHAEPDLEQQVPYACLKRRDGETWCGRQVQESREYVFNDVDWAMKNHRRGRSFGVCNKCAARARANGVQDPMFQAPMSVRGLKENDR